MPTVVLMLFAGPGTRQMDGQSGNYMRFGEHLNENYTDVF